MTDARAIVGGRHPRAAVRRRGEDHGRHSDAGAGRAQSGPEAENAPSIAGAALDLLLTEAGLDTRARFLPGRETVRLVTRLARRPGRVVRRGSALTGELAKVVAGRSELKLPRGDRRFLDPAWSDSWIYRRLLQAYLAMDETVDGVIGDAELDWADDRKMRFIAQNIVDALAPANAPLVNPEVLKGAIDTGGRNFVRGARQFARDMREPPRLPANVDVSEFVVGRDIGLTPGAVVLRDERFELIQYQPATPEVREVPILLVPPMINKFYIMDLAPGPQPHRAPGGAAGSRSSRSPGATRAPSIATGAWTRTPTRWSRRSTRCWTSRAAIARTSSATARAVW